MPPSLYKLLQQSTVKITSPSTNKWGTGFFVARDKVITCAHVIQNYEAEVIQLIRDGRVWATATVDSICHSIDLALLQVELPKCEDLPPCVMLDDKVSPFDRLYVYGYPDDFPDGGSVTINCEGDVEDKGVTLIKAQAGQVRPGHSGSPALNNETGRVCGIVSETRGRSTNLGGLLIPVSTLFSQFQKLEPQNREAWEQDKRWRDLESASPIAHNNLKNSGIAKFVGRKTVLNQIHEKLKTAERIAISTLSGMGGIGKTELALQYAWQEWRKGSYASGICWVDVKNNDFSSDVTSFFEHKLQLGQPRGETPAEKVQYCWDNWIDGDVLIIFDDIRNSHQFFEYLPPYESERFKVIITTRCEYLSDVIENIHLEELSEDASLDLLRSYVDKNRINSQIEEAKLLCQDLGYLPLALELIARLLRKRIWSIKDTREKLKQRGLKSKNSLLSKKHPEMTAKEGIKAAFSLSWDELSDNPKIQKIALCLSLFAVAPIQKIWIEELFPYEDRDDIEEWLIDSLVNLNLVNLIGKNQYELHRLIHLYLKETLDESDFSTTIKQHYCELFISKSEKFTQTLSPQKIEDLTPLIPHIKQIIKHHYNHIVDDAYISGNWNLPIKAISNFYVSQGFYPQAIQYFREYIETTKKKFGEFDIHLMVLSNDFALVLKDRGQYVEALRLLNQARTIAINHLGNNHHETMMITNAIGDTYRQLGEYERAEEILSELLPKVLPKNIFNQNIEEIYISVLIFCVPNNLGLVFDKLKRYDEAEVCFKIVLNYFETDKNNVYYAQAATNLGGLYIEMKRYEEAELYLIEALDINKIILDPKHINYRLNLAKLSILYVIQNKLDHAENLLVELFELQLNLDYLEPKALSDLKYIASQYFDKGLYEQVEKTSIKMHQLYQKFQLTNSIEYCESLNLLAKSYTHTKKLKKAIQLMKEAIDIEKTHFSASTELNAFDGSDAFTGLTVISSFQTLGMAWWNLAQENTHPTQLGQRISALLKAEKCTRNSLDLFQKFIEKNENDRYINSAIHNSLGLILEDLEKYSEAEVSYKNALRLRREEYGNKHYLVGQSLLNLAGCYEWQRKNNDVVEEMLLECKTIWEELLETNHPEMVHCYACLAGFYNRLRQFKKAIHYYQKAIENCRSRKDTGDIIFYQQKLERCVKRSLKLKTKKSNRPSKKPKGFG
ncbi:MAG: tetratricopeptide repeat protein [Cyanobacteria bacterium P01_G01_bin.38]